MLTAAESLPAMGDRKRWPWRTLMQALALVLLAFALSSCHAGDDTMGLDVVGYNHTDRDIGSFSVGNGGGGYLGKHEQGGSVCCISIPRIYKPGMTVIVRWGGIEVGETKERTVAVPPYIPDDGGHFAVHFLRNGEIRVFVSMHYLENPNYPLKGDDARM